MTKKRTRQEHISDDRKRNIVFGKRLESLTKKANDLSVLCGVDIGMVVHKPDDNNVLLWPSPEVFGSRLQKFLDCPEIERKRKMVIHDKYLEDRVKDEREEVKKLAKKNKMIETKALMTEVVMKGKSLDEVDLAQLNDLKDFAAEMLQKLQKRDEELDLQQL